MSKPGYWLIAALRPGDATIEVPEGYFRFGAKIEECKTDEDFDAIGKAIAWWLKRRVETEGWPK